MALAKECQSFLTQAQVLHAAFGRKEYIKRDERGAEDSTGEQGDIDAVVGGHLGVQVPNRLDMLLSHAQVGDLA